MEVRKSGKIAIGIIAALGTIGILHVVIFKDKASEYQAARNQYESVLATYRNQGKSPDIDSIRRFEYETIRQKLRYWQALSSMDIALPEDFTPDKFDEANVREGLWDFLRELERLRAEGAAGNGPTLTFLDDTTSLNEPGWGLVDSLPDTYTQNRIAPEDDMQQLRNEDRLLDSLDKNTNVYQSRLQNYNAILFKLGLNVNAREFLKERFGGVFSNLYTLNRLDQVMKNMPSDFFGNMTEQQSRKLMYKLFRIEWPKDFNDNESLLPATRQLQGMIDMIEAASAAGIKDIPYVKLHQTIPVYWEDPDKSKLTPTPAANEGGMFAGEFAMGGMDEAAMGMFGDPAMSGGFGRGGFGGGGFATPTPATAFDSVGAPIEMIVRGSNAAVMEWIYSLTHSGRALELDRLRIVNVSPQEGEILASVYFNVVALSTGLGVLSEDEVARNLVDTAIELKKVASSRPAVSELAVEDGLMVKEGNTYRWIGPEPTPVPGAPAATTAAPPPAGAVDPMNADMNLR